MVIAERYGIILKSETAGNSEDGSHNSATVFFEYISLPNIISVLVFEFGKLPDCIFINLYIFYPTPRPDSTNHWNMVVIPNLQVAIYPFPIVEALASEFNLSHNYSCLRLLILSISTFKFISAQRTSRCNSSSRAICSSSIRGHPRSQLS